MLRAILAVLATLIITTMGQAAPAVTVAPAAGPPTSKLVVNGTGFGVSKLVEVYFDVTNKCLAVTSTAGAFSCAFRVPADATAGGHWVTAFERLTGTSAQLSFQVRTDMAQFHGRNAAHVGLNPFENSITADSAAALDTLWSQPIGQNGTYATPVVAGGIVYIGSTNGHVFAFNASTGVAIGGFPIDVGATIANSSPAVALNRVYVGTTDGKLHAFNALNGAAVAGFPVALCGNVTTAPALALGIIYAGCSDGKVYARNAKTGAAIAGFPIVSGGSVYSSPTVIDGHIYFGSTDGKIYGADALTGATLAGFPITTLGAIYGSVATTAGTGFVGSLDMKLHAFKLADGVPVPGFPVNVGSPVFTSPAIHQNRVYVGDNLGYIHAYRISDGVSALVNLLEAGVTVAGSPMVAGGVVYLSDAGRLYAVDALSGDKLWSAAATGFLNAPVIADGILYYGSTDGSLYAYSVDGLSPAASRPGGQLGVMPAPWTLKPDRSLTAVTP